MHRKGYPCRIANCRPTNTVEEPNFSCETCLQGFDDNSVGIQEVFEEQRRGARGTNVTPARGKGMDGNAANHPATQERGEYTDTGNPGWNRSQQGMNRSWQPIPGTEPPQKRPREVVKEERDVLEDTTDIHTKFLEDEYGEELRNRNSQSVVSSTGSGTLQSRRRTPEEQLHPPGGAQRQRGAAPGADHRQAGIGGDQAGQNSTQRQEGTETLGQTTWTTLAQSRPTLVLDGPMGRQVIQSGDTYWNKPVSEYLVDLAYYVGGIDLTKRPVEVDNKGENNEVVAHLHKFRTAAEFFQVGIARTDYRMDLRGTNLIRFVQPNPLFQDVHCCYYARRGRCRDGNRCPFSHTVKGKARCGELKCDRCDPRHGKFPCWRHMGLQESTQPAGTWS